METEIAISPAGLFQSPRPSIRTGTPALLMTSVVFASGPAHSGSAAALLDARQPVGQLPAFRARDGLPLLGGGRSRALAGKQQQGENAAVKFVEGTSGHRQFASSACADKPVGTGPPGDVPPTTAPVPSGVPQREESHALDASRRIARSLAAGLLVQRRRRAIHILLVVALVVLVLQLLSGRRAV